MEREEPMVMRRGSCTIIIRRPKLTAAERKKEEERIKASLESTMRSYIRRREQINVHQHPSGAI